MFSISSHVRYSEVDDKGNMTVDSIINYLQDCVMLHSDRVGYGVLNLEKHPGIWFLSSWQIEVVRIPTVYENIQVFTYPYKFKGVFGNRYFEMKTSEGELLVKANSIWAYLDNATHGPRKIDMDQVEAFAPDDIVPDMECLSRKINLPEELLELPAIPVRPGQIDTNSHVNNCEYVRTVLEATGVTEIPKRIRAEYKLSAVLGDNFHPFVYRDDKCLVCDLRGDDGTAYAAVEFIF